MASFYFKAYNNGSWIILPAPVLFRTGDEIIWSAETGRVASGKMVGDVLAEKKVLDVTWGVLTASEMLIIKNCLCAGFPRIRFEDCGEKYGDSTPFYCYRSTLTKELLGTLSDGITYYRNASVQLIQR